LSKKIYRRLTRAGMLFKRLGSWCGVKFAQLYPYIDQYPIKVSKKIHKNRPIN